VREADVSCPSVKTCTPNPLDLRKEAIYPREIGVEAGTKGFISRRRIFTVQSIRNRKVTVKGKDLVLPWTGDML
jgi:hypothetical protein